MKVSYTAIVLCEQSHFQLLDLIPQGWRPFAHHVTMNMKGWAGPAEFLGKEFNIKVVSHAADENVSACGVLLPEEISLWCANAQPHITIACSNDGRPVQANALDWSNAEPIKVRELSGRLCEVYHNGKTSMK